MPKKVDGMGLEGSPGDESGGAALATNTAETTNKRAIRKECVLLMSFLQLHLTAPSV
jgi:hypothetical protein